MTPNILYLLTTMSFAFMFLGFFLIFHGLHGKFWFGSDLNNASVGVIMMVLGFVLFINIPSNPFTELPERDWNTIEIQNITSLSRDQSSSIHGGASFLLGTGHGVINGKTVTEYTFYKVLPDGYQVGTMDATNVFIREDENRFPYIEQDHHHSKLATKIYNDTGNIDLYEYGFETDTVTKTVIHVPNGTIYKDYTV
jgi:hypothetical protein